MGLRYTTRLYKPENTPDIDAAVVKAAATIGARLEKSTNQTGKLLRISESHGIYTCECPYQDGDHSFFTELSRVLGAIWLEARIQEGSHWDYTLSYPGIMLDNFSTLPEYWEDDELIKMAKEGRPKILAAAWGVPLEQIERYIRQWGMVDNDDETYSTALKGKAYPDDQAEYGDYEQLFDLLKKLHHADKYRWSYELTIPRRNFDRKRDFVEDLSVGGGA